MLPKNVLVVGRGLYALQLCRAYDIAGCKVFLATSAALDFTRASLAVTKSYLVTKPLSSNEESILSFSSDIQTLIFELEIDFLVPAAEEGYFVSMLQPKWTSNGCKCRILAMPFHLIEKLHDKYLFQKLCANWVKTPLSELAQTPSQVIEYAKSIHEKTKCGKIVVKPVFTRGGRSMWLLEAPFTQFTGVVSEESPVVVQQFITGEEFSSYSVVSQGRILAHVCYKCLFPVKGFASVRLSMHKPAILDWVATFVSNVSQGFSGQVAFDFIETAEGDIYALECNPRGTNGITFFVSEKNITKSFCQAQYEAADPYFKGNNSLLSKSPSKVFSMATEHVVEPPTNTSIATFLLALTLLRKNPTLYKTLKTSHPDMEWPSDPFPLLAALGKSAKLYVESIRKIMDGASFPDLAAQATEDELVKFDCKPTVQMDLERKVSGSWVNLPASCASPISPKILVTGATGFLGSQLALKLAEEGHSVVATGRNRKEFERTLGDKKFENLEFVACDLTDKSAVKSLVKNVDVVVHCAAKCSPWGLLSDFLMDNVEVTRFLLEASTSPDSSVTRFIHISSPSISFAIDDAQPRMFHKESDSLPPAEKQGNYYAYSKMLAEKVILDEFKSNKVCVTILRPRAIYGEGDRALFPRLVSRLRIGKLPQIGDGKTIVDLTHVDNVCHAVSCAMKTPKEICHRKIYNITDCEPQRLWSVIDMICNELEIPAPKLRLPRSVMFYVGYALEIIYGKLLEAGITDKEPMLSRYAVNVLSVSQTLDCSLARDELGYFPIVKTTDGLKRFLDSIREEEMKIPFKRTNPNLVLYILPAFKSFLVYLLCSFLVYPLEMTFFYFWISMFFFTSASFVFFQRKGRFILSEETRKRRNRSKFLSGQSEDGKRPRPWRKVINEDEKFIEATRAAPSLALNPSCQHLLSGLYGLFKQQKDGDCNIPPPNMMLAPKDYGKWKAWSVQTGLSKEDARRKYIECVEEGFDILDEQSDPVADRERDLAYKEKVQYKVRIEGVGRYLPKKIVPTSKVEELCGLEPGWSNLHNVGVKNRRWAEPENGETNSFMAGKAIEEACENAKIKISNLDLIINCSASNERILPDGSCFVKRALKLENTSIACFSIHATCLSFIVGMDVAASLIQSGRYKNVAIVSSEVSSVACDFTQPESCLLLGDGAAACILSPTSSRNSSCIHTALFENFCKGVEAATLRTGTLKHPKDQTTQARDHLFDMNGPQIVESMKEVGPIFLEKLRPGLSSRLPYDYDLVVPHQPSGAAMDMLVAHGWPRERTINIVGEYGNCVAASTGMALYEAIETGRLKRGMKFIMIGTGGGITLGALVLTY